MKLKQRTLESPPTTDKKIPLYMGRVFACYSLYACPCNRVKLPFRSQALYPLSYWGVTAIIPD